MTYKKPQRYSKQEKLVPRDISESLGKLPPQANDLEEAVLGALMLEKNAINEIIDILSTEDFYQERHKEIYNAIVSLYRVNSPIDMRTVRDSLSRVGKIETIGGAYYIAELTSKVSSVANIEYHARVVAEMAMKRRLIETASEIHHDAYEDTADVFELLEKSQKSLDGIAGRFIRASAQEAKNIFSDVVKNMINASKKEGLVGLPSGYTALDRIMGGFKEPEFIIIAARPSMGKSAFIGNIARNIAVDFKKPVAIFSLEMSAHQLMQRMIAAEAEIDLDRIIQGTYDQMDWQKVLDKTSRLQSAPIFIDDTAGLSIIELRAKARRLKNEKGIEMVIVDYLQLMKGDRDSNSNREQEISSISRAMKGLAKELKIPVLALSQLSRAVEQRGGDKRPQLSDLRECLAEDTSMIWTNNGVLSNDNSRINLLSLNKQGKVENMNSDNIEKKTNTVYRLKTMSGRYVDCTAKHQVLTDRGYVQLKDIKTDDSIVCISETPEGEDKKYIRESKFIGWMLGNGSCIGYNSPSFITNDLDVITEFNAFIFKKWGFYPKEHKHWSNSVYQVDITKSSTRTPGGNPVKNWMKDKGLHDFKAHEKHIPDWFLKTANNKSISELLAGLYETDGSIAVFSKGNRTNVQYSTTSHILATQIVYCLSRFGIVGKIDSGAMSDKANFSCYKIIIGVADMVDRFRKNIKLTGYKRKILDDFVPHDRGSNYEVLSKVTSKKIIDSVGLEKRWQNKGMRFKSFMQLYKEHPKKLKEFSWLASSDIFLSRVSSIEKIGIRKVFDRQVPKNNNFIVNGICVHNSGSLEQDSDVVAFLYRAEYYKITQYEDGSPTAGVMEVIIAKNRNGACDTVQLKFMGKYSKVSDFDYKPHQFVSREAPKSFKDFQVSRQEHNDNGTEESTPF